MDGFFKNFKKFALVSTILLLGLQGCATIPGEAPELSAELGNRISAIENAHFNLLHKYFDERRQQVDELITNEWVPEFAEQVFTNPAIENVWAEIVRSNNKQDRLQFLVRVGPKLQAKINAKRMELIKPLDDAEKILESTLRDEYQQTRAINNSITSFLISAAKVDENRARYMNMLGVTDQKIADAVDRVDSAVEILLDKAKELPDKQKRAEKYLEKVNNILEKLKK